MLATGNHTLDAILQIVGAIYLLLSVLSHVLPRSWRITQIIARIVLDMRGIGAKAPSDPNAEKPPTIPPVVGVLLLGIAMAISSATPGCSATKAPDTAAMVERSAALAFNGAVVALEVLDAHEAAYLDSIGKPTPEQLQRAAERVARLKRARDSLEIVRGWLSGEREGGKQALQDALLALEFVADELTAQGVKIPSRVTDGLRVARLFAGLS